MENTTTTPEFATGKPKSLTAADINKIKTDFDCEVVCLTVGDKAAWFRSPDFVILDAANAQKKSRDYHLVIAKNCFLAGDTEVITREKYFISLIPKMDAVITPFAVEIKNY